MVKNLPANPGRCRRHRFSPWVRKTLWRRALFFPGESDGQRSLVGCSPYIWSHRVGHDCSNLAHTMCLNFFFLTVVQMSSYPQHFLDLPSPCCGSHPHPQMLSSFPFSGCQNFTSPSKPLSDTPYRP